MPDNDFKGRESYDLIVVGAGAIGLTCAWRAAREGLDVCLLERGQAGQGATGVAAGMLAPVGEASWGEERLLRANLRAAERWPGFAAEVEADAGMPVGYREDGALHVALDRDEAEELRRRHELQLELGLDARWLRPSECRSLEPGLATRVAGGVHASSEADVDPRALLGALLAALAASGAEMRFGDEPAESILEGERLAGVRTRRGGELRARHVVLATGAWSGGAGWLPEGCSPPVRPVKGQILALRADRAPCDRIVASDRVYLVPRADGRLIVGATVEEMGFDEAVTAGGVHELLREAYRLLPEVAEMELLETAASLRPGSPDNAPIVGEGALDGLILATGHYRNGVLLAPLTADAVLATVGGRTVDETMASFDPRRFEREGVVA